MFRCFNLYAYGDSLIIDNNSTHQSDSDNKFISAIYLFLLGNSEIYSQTSFNFIFKITI